MQIIAHNSIPTPLLTNAKPNDNEKLPLIPRRLPNRTPFLLLGLLLQLNRSHDLAELELYHLIIAIAVGMVVGEDGERGVFTPLRDEPTR